MTTHCVECGSEMCNHGNCPECNPCRHCYGGDRSNKYFGQDDPRSQKAGSDVDRYLDQHPTAEFQDD